jgi:endonuclease YncB( thermonuclease family)
MTKAAQAWPVQLASSLLLFILFSVDRVHADTVDNKPSRPIAGAEGVFDGPVTWVTDGDSLYVRVRGRDMEVRLADVDAPERDQPYGWSSKLKLLDLVRNRHLVLAPRDVDRYGRVVARVWAGEMDVNRELVKQGAAWFYPEYAEDESLYNEEQRARDRKLGLWALPAEQRIEPSEWRRRKRDEEPIRRSEKSKARAHADLPRESTAAASWVP